LHAFPCQGRAASEGGEILAHGAPTPGGFTTPIVKTRPNKTSPLPGTDIRTPVLQTPRAKIWSSDTTITTFALTSWVYVDSGSTSTPSAKGVNDRLRSHRFWVTQRRATSHRGRRNDLGPLLVGVSGFPIQGGRNAGCMRLSRRPSTTDGSIGLRTSPRKEQKIARAQESDHYPADLAGQNRSARQEQTQRWVNE
jgi:hypothetical protein